MSIDGSEQSMPWTSALKGQKLPTLKVCLFSRFRYFYSISASLMHGFPLLLDRGNFAFLPANQAEPIFLPRLPVILIEPAKTLAHV